MKSAHRKAVMGKVIVYAILILIAVVMIFPVDAFRIHQERQRSIPDESVCMDSCKSQMG